MATIYPENLESNGIKVISIFSSIPKLHTFLNKNKQLQKHLKRYLDKIKNKRNIDIYIKPTNVGTETVKQCTSGLPPRHP
jgi:hypothetical protein